MDHCDCGFVEITKEKMSSFNKVRYGCLGLEAPSSCRGHQDDKCHLMWSSKEMILCFGASVPTDGVNACVGQ